MPLFNIFKPSSHFSPRKANPRKAKLPPSMENCPNRQKELGVELNEIKLKLGVVTSSFDENGNWRNDLTTSSDYNKQLITEVIKLRKLNEKLVKEHNMVRVKNEILLDMVSLSQLKLQKLNSEVDDLKEILSKSPLRFAELES